jgi:hypothetical protein
VLNVATVKLLLLLLLLPLLLQLSKSAAELVIVHVDFQDGGYRLTVLNLDDSAAN